MAAHPNKHIREAIKCAEQHGWTFVKAGEHAHIYGVLYCPRRDRDGHDFMFTQRLDIPKRMPVTFDDT